MSKAPPIPKSSMAGRAGIGDLGTAAIRRDMFYFLFDAKEL